jgi:anti-anti-sigma regulatory factor
VQENFVQTTMLRIQRSANDKVIFTLSGRIEAEHLEELQRVCSLEMVDRLLVLDLKDVTLVARDAVQYLARCEANGVQLENCPAYIREWIERERGQNGRRNR